MIIVSGSSGKLGRLVVEQLIQRGAASDVRALSRNPEKLADLTAQGVETRAADFDDPVTLPTAFEGGDVLLLISTDNIVEPGARIREHRAAIEAARSAGIPHVVYTSAPSPVPANPVPITRDHAATEQMLRESGLKWTMLRNNLYTDFLIEAGAINPGGLVGNTGEGRTPHVTRNDCAASAVAILLNPAPHAGQTYDINGPEAPTLAEIAAILTEVAGRPVPLVNLDDATYRAGVIAAGVPPFLADVVVTYGVATRDGWMGEASSAVADLTGRPATTVRAWFEANRPALLTALGGD